MCLCVFDVNSFLRAFQGKCHEPQIYFIEMNTEVQSISWPWGTGGSNLRSRDSFNTWVIVQGRWGRPTQMAEDLRRGGSRGGQGAYGCQKERFWIKAQHYGSCRQSPRTHTNLHSPLWKILSQERQWCMFFSVFLKELVPFQPKGQLWSVTLWLRPWGLSAGVKGGWRCRCQLWRRPRMELVCLTSLD